MPLATLAALPVDGQALLQNHMLKHLSAALLLLHTITLSAQKELTNADIWASPTFNSKNVASVPRALAWARRADHL